MKRWGMLDDGEMPEPNVNIRLAMDWLDRFADGMSLSMLGTVIPMLEVALDGALLKFLLEEVNDPVCHQVFEKINNDESRHLAVDFEVLDMIGHAKARKLADRLRRQRRLPGSDHRRPSCTSRCSTGCATRSSAMGLRARTAVQGGASGSAPSASAASTPAGCRPTGCSSGTPAVVTNPRHPYHLLANSDGVAVGPLPAAAAEPDPVVVQRTHPRAGGLTWLTPRCTTR